jgi:hypothetical protein
MTPRISLQRSRGRTDGGREILHFVKDDILGLYSYLSDTKALFMKVVESEGQVI